MPRASAAESAATVLPVSGARRTPRDASHLFLRPPPHLDLRQVRSVLCVVRWPALRGWRVQLRLPAVPISSRSAAPERQSPVLGDAGSPATSAVGPGTKR